MTDRTVFSAALDQIAQQFPEYQGLLESVTHLIRDGKEKELVTTLQQLAQEP